MIELLTTIKKIVYYSGDTHWGVLSVDNTFDDTVLFPNNDIKVAGNFEGLYEGCKVELKGDLKNHPTFGNQIELKFYKILRDTTDKESIVNFLAKSTIKGISIQNAIKIYDTHKELSIDVVLHNTAELRKIKGIGEKTIQKILKSVQTYKDMEQLLKYCLDLGFSYNLITKLYKELGKGALDKIKSNIYSVLDYTDVITFKQLDTVALNNGTSVDDINRLRYGFLYTLKTRVLFEGSTGCSSPELKNHVLKELGTNDNHLYTSVLNQLVDDNKIYLENNKVYYKKYYDIEKQIASRVIQIVNTNNESAIDTEIVKEEINSLPFKLNTQQLNTVQNVLSSNISIITGSGGTGKTSLLRVLSNIFIRNNFNVNLLAPTGKASRRIEECTGRKAHTIHRFLGLKGNLDEKVKTVDKNSVIFVDESSMLDILVFDKLLEALNTDTKLILLGDVKQLPSVQVGNLLEDLMSSNKISVNILTDIMRQAKESNIIRLCNDINNGESLEPCKHNDFVYKKYQDPDKLIKDFKSLYDSELNKNDNEIQILTPYKKGTVGTHFINSLISDLYNPNELNEKFGFKLDDRVMQIRNNYAKDVFNGEVGYIRFIDDDEMLVDFGADDMVSYETHEVDELMLSYCVTVHKCQGSEYKTIFVLLDDSNPMLMMRKILYTGLSRGKQKVYLMAMNNSVDKCVLNDYYKPRITRLKFFLDKYIKADKI